MNRLRSSTLPYLAVWAVAVVGSVWIQYMWPHAVLLKGQPPSIVFVGALWLLSLPLWWLAPRRMTRPSRGLLLFVGLLGASWLVHLTFAIVHEDNFNHLVWIFLPTLVLFMVKPPNRDEAWTTLVVVAWAVTAILVVTRTLEALGVIDRYYVEPYVVDFDLSHYWLPFSGSLGILGKWTGPYGASAHTAMAAGFVFVVGVIRWTRSSWVFVILGIYVYLLSASRTMLLACVAAVAIVLLFAPWSPMARAKVWVRWALLGLLSLAGAAILFATGPGLTGRQSIWPAYLDVWRTSPLIGVGRNGIESAGGLAAQSDVAHNLFIDLLARYGLIGLLVPLAALAVCVWLSLRAAGHGVPGPAALIVAYLIFSMTDVRNEWIEMNSILFIVVLATAWAADVARPGPLPAPSNSSEALAT